MREFATLGFVKLNRVGLYLLIQKLQKVVPKIKQISRKKGDLVEKRKNLKKGLYGFTCEQGRVFSFTWFGLRNLRLPGIKCVYDQKGYVVSMTQRVDMDQLERNDP